MKLPPKKSKLSFSKKRIPKEAKKEVVYLLDTGNIHEMREAKRLMDNHLKYQWDFYSILARQRNLIKDGLKSALIQKTIKNFKFNGWQRAVKYKYALHPLGTKGSLVFNGQRFNAGNDINSMIQSFPALYIATDKDTALQETLGQLRQPGSTLTARELALTSLQSETILSVSGSLDEVIDLRDHKNLKPFIEQMKKFKIDDSIKQEAKKIGANTPQIIKDSSILLDTLLDPNWRIHPMNDIPSNSQIFGQIVYQANIQGILYPSKFTKKECLAIFIHNFNNSNSYIQLDDPPPIENVVTKIGPENWRIADLNYEEIVKS